MWYACDNKNENEIEISLPHIRLTGRLWGEPGQPLLLALHGWLDNANSFEPLARHLTGYQLLAIDWPGHGHSAHRSGHYPLHWVDYIFDLEVLIDSISQEHTLAGIVGHSLGGIVAAGYTATFPERVPKLVLMEAVSPLFESASKNRQRLNNSVTSHLNWLRKSSKPLAVYDSIEVAVKARSRLTGLEESWCRLLVERNMQQHDLGVSWRSDPRLKLDSPMRLTFEQVDALMSAHSVDTLLMTAKEGYEQVTRLMPKAEAWFNQLTCVQLSGDHHFHMSNAEAVAQSIDLFMAQ